MKRIIAAVILCALVFNLLGCSIFMPRNQNISVVSEPPGAGVTINGNFAGNTPLSHQVRRSQNCSIMLRKRGYETVMMNTSQELSVTGILDTIGLWIVLVPGIGLFTPGAYQQEPSNFSITLQPVTE